MAVRVNFHYSRHLGPRFVQAGVTLEFGTAEEFGFSSEAKWPGENCDKAVREGVEAGFVAKLGFLPQTHVALLAVEWHEVDSSRKAFEMAARAATEATFIV